MHFFMISLTFAYSARGLKLMSLLCFYRLSESENQLTAMACYSLHSCLNEINDIKIQSNHFGNLKYFLDVTNLITTH